jgi:hypothetical protein
MVRTPFILVTYFHFSDENTRARKKEKVFLGHSRRFFGKSGFTACTSKNQSLFLFIIAYSQASANRVQ